MGPVLFDEKRAEAQEAVSADLSDHSLVQSFKLGSQEAATLLYRRYANRLRALARSKCSPDLAGLACWSAGTSGTRRRPG